MKARWKRWASARGKAVCRCVVSAWLSREKGSGGGARRAAGALAGLFLSMAVLPRAACSVSAASSGPPTLLAPGCDPPLLSP